MELVRPPSEPPKTFKFDSRRSPDVASAVYMPECPRTARILDHSGVDLQGVAELIYSNKPSPSIPVFFGPISASRTRVPHLVAPPFQPGL